MENYGITTTKVVARKKVTKTEIGKENVFAGGMFASLSLHFGNRYSQVFTSALPYDEEEPDDGPGNPRVER